MEIYGDTSSSSDNIETPGTGVNRPADQVVAMASEFGNVHSKQDLEDFKSKYGATDEEIGALRIAASVAHIMSAWKVADDIDNPTADDAAEVEKQILEILESLSGQEIAASIVVISMYAFKWAIEQKG